MMIISLEMNLQELEKNLEILVIEGGERRERERERERKRGRKGKIERESHKQRET